MVEVRNRKRKVMIKPNIVRDYNAGISGVDRSDQMLSYYSAVPCRICTKNKKRKETRYFCAACEDLPPLCVVECFKAYHLNA